MEYGFRGVKIFALEGSDLLANKVCQELNNKLPDSMKPDDGLKLIKVVLDDFDNENVQVQIEKVRGYFTVVIHTQCPPVNTRLMELFALLDAIYNSNPADLLLAFPYMPYARSDRKDQPRISVMSKVLAETFNNVLGVRRVLLLDPHDSHVKHYFKPSADEISSIYMYADFLLYWIEENLGGKKDDVLIAFSDGGAAKRFHKLPKITGLRHDYIDKIRLDNKGTIKIERDIDCQGKTCFMVDDELCSGGTAIEDAKALNKNRAAKIIMLAPHAPLSKKRMESRDLIARLNDSPIDHFLFTDTIPSDDKIQGEKKFHILSVAGLLAEAIAQTIANDSVTKLHEPDNVQLYRPDYSKLILPL
ncbi:ribose-phosphate pyrophosphokinase [Candidatus Falkowbacteria bacterium]|nr:ribose-phosphate pyrophosphokinase [Candidatus Falkowbacteria bacterium]